MIMDLLRKLFGKLRRATPVAAPSSTPAPPPAPTTLPLPVPLPGDYREQLENIKYPNRTPMRNRQLIADLQADGYLQPGGPPYVLTQKGEQAVADTTPFGLHGGD